MVFLEAMSDYIDISDEFDKANMTVTTFVESVCADLDINIQKSELKVMTESGTDDDLAYLVEAATEGAIAKIKKTVQVIIEAFTKFISDLKDKVVRVVVNKTTRDTLSKVEKKVKLNPFIARKKVQVVDKKKPLAVIEKYKNKCDKNIAKVKGGIFKQSDVEGIFKDRDDFDKDYKAAVAGTAAMTTITVANLIKTINSELDSLPKTIDSIGKETTDIVNRFCDSIEDDEVIASTRAAYSACANFRTKLGKYESNEHVDFIMQAIGVLKKEVAKIKGNTEADVAKESTEGDDFDGAESFFEDGYDSESLLAELEDLL